MIDRAHVVMVGDKVRAVFTDGANNGDGLLAAEEFCRGLAGSSEDDPQQLAKQNAAWIALAPNLNGQEIDVPTLMPTSKPG